MKRAANKYHTLSRNREPAFSADTANSIGGYFKIIPAFTSLKKYPPGFAAISGVGGC